ncbi:hypothetical protein [Euzebya sp.]|uniref:hypothetical protein n=1 Tax=Euzebya sp. TaxID=1971409 RepID=UPI0035163E01
MAEDRRSRPRPSPSRMAVGVAIGVVIALLIALSGCAADDAAEAAADTTGDDEGTDVIEVGLVDFAFAGLPGEVAPGTRLTVTNDAEAELHELVAFRLADDEERPATELAELAPDELLSTLGEPTAVLLAPPGGEQIAAVGDGTLAEEGRYAIFCFIPTGVDPQTYLEASAESEGGPPDVGGGPPHFTQGMLGEITVG